MLRVHQIPLALDAAQHFDEEMLRAMAAKALGVSPRRIAAVKLQKRSIDARDHGKVCFMLTVDVSLGEGESAERSLAGRYKPNQVAFFPTAKDASPRDVFHLSLAPWPKAAPRPLVVGAGPAGLFCALALALRGARPVLLERGQAVEQRTKDVGAFVPPAAPTLAAQGAFAAGLFPGGLNPESNILFGEGGAGAFSDGKLTCGINNPLIRTVLETFCACGAPEDILTAQRPHIGTDRLRGVLAQIRAKLIAHGAQVLFGHRLDGLTLKNGRVIGAQVSHGGGTEVWDADTVFLATGHSARDTYAWLYALGLPMEAKPFAIGARIEHLQRDIGRAQYGGAWEHPALPPADYKLNTPTPDKRGVYTFCMCPGGQVIGAMHEAGTVNVNGMSFHARNGINANAALLTGVTPADFGSDHPLAGVAFQQRIEKAAFVATGGFAAPCQRVGDLLAGQASQSTGKVAPSYLPGVQLGELAACLPAFVVENFRYALPILGKKLRGFDDPDALLTGPETRSSSPVRLLRDARRESGIPGLYPLGEGAGYAGGIVSAAVDGLCAGMET